jgi:hypothetical protein
VACDLGAAAAAGLPHLQVCWPRAVSDSALSHWAHHRPDSGHGFARSTGVSSSLRAPRREAAGSASGTDLIGPLQLINPRAELVVTGKAACQFRWLRRKPTFTTFWLACLL